MAIVGVAGTTDLGVVDPNCELSEIASANSLYFHVDARFGGFVLLFLEELGYPSLDFDFSLPDVCSITIDPHKMGLAPIPAGGILFRDKKLAEVVSTRNPYLSGGETGHTSVLGTRSGASAVAVWALLKHLGRAGYRDVVKNCLNLTWKLAEEIEHLDGLNVAVKPTLNVLGMKSDKIDVRVIFQELKKRGWAVSLFSNYIRIVIMPHTESAHIRNFVEDLKKSISN